MSEPQVTETALSDSRKWLWQAFARSVRDNIFAEIALQIIRVSGIIVLARTLIPADFGVFRILTIVLWFGAIPVETGISDALIQRRDLRPEHEATGWYLCVAIAVLMAAVTYAAAPILAALMGMAAITPEIRLLCIPLALEGCAITSVARLKRELRFGAIATAEVIAELVFIGAALLLVWKGYPRWSLAGGYAGRMLCYAAVILIADRRFVFKLPRMWAARDLARFTTSVWGARLVHGASDNAHFVLIGRLLGSSALGFYSMAWDLLRFVPDRMGKVAGRVAFPAFARMQDDNEELAQAFLQFASYAALFVLPMMCLVAIAAPEVIHVLYGPKWTATVVPLRLLSIGFLLVGLRFGIGSIYYSKDHPSFDIYLHGFRLTLILATVIPLAAFGLGSVCAGMSVVEAVISIVGLYLVCVLIDLRPKELASAFVPAARLAALCAISSVVGKAIGIGAGLAPLAVLAIELALPGILFLWLQAPMFVEMIGKAFGQKGDAAGPRDPRTEHPAVSQGVRE